MAPTKVNKNFFHKISAQSNISNDMVIPIAAMRNANKNKNIEI